jgi:cell division protein ZapA (FtsZ GTPase activity inhibitor)
MRRLVAGLGLVAVLGLTACGGGSGDKKATPTTTTTPTTVPAPTTTVLSGNDQAGTRFCQLLKTYKERFDNLLPSVNDPAKLKAATSDVDTAIRDLKDSAPAQVKPDVTTVAATVSDVVTALKKANYVFANTEPAQVAKLSDQNFQNSVDRLTAYGQAHCGLS